MLPSSRFWSRITHSAPVLARLRRRHAIAMVAFVAGMVLAVGAGLNLKKDYDAAIHAAAFRTQRRALILETQTRQELQRIEALGKHVVREWQSAARRSAGAAEMRHQLDTHIPASNLIRAFLVVPADGHVQSAHRPANTPEEALPPRVVEEALASHRTPGTVGMKLGTPYRSEPSGKWLLPVSFGLAPAGGSFQGVLLALVEAAYFQQLYTLMDPDDGGFATAFLLSGWIVVRSPQDPAVLERNWLQSPMFKEHLPRQPHGTVRQVVAANQVESIYTYRSLGDYPLVVVDGQSLTAALVPWRERAWRDGLLMVLAFASLLSATWALLRQLERGEQTESALRISEDRFRSLTELSSDWYWEQDSAWRFTHIEGTVGAKDGLAIQRPVGQALWEIAGVEPGSGDWAAHRHMLEQRLAFRNLQLKVTDPQGHVSWVAISGTPVHDPQGQFSGYRGVGTDITDRVHDQELLAQTTDLLRRSSEIANIGGWEYDMVERHLRWSDQTCRIHDLPPGSNPGPREALAFFPPEARQVLESAIQTAVTEGTPWDLELPLVTATGRSIWVRSQGSSLAEGGRCRRIVGSLQDITERKQSDAVRDSLEAQLRQSQKMQAIGTLAGGIAHDFNTLIATILGNAALAEQDAQGNPQALASIAEIGKAAQRARDLVQQILSFSRRQPTELKSVELEPVLHQAARMLRSLMPARTTISVHCEEGVSAVMADTTQIHQVLLNLANNALHAMKGKPGTIEFQLGSAVLDADMAARHRELEDLLVRSPGKVVWFRVSDSGEGMDAGTLARIFEPFFTTKPAGEGTGLGLAVVHGIVQSHGGAIVVESQLHRGTSVTVYLPPAHAASLPPAESAGHSGATPTPPEQRHVMYVDDDEALASLVRRLLQRRGYRVSSYTNPQDALDAFQTDPRAFDLVLTDYNMPGLSGLDMARAIRAVSPQIPVVITSGFIDETLQSQAASVGASGLIFKPDTVQGLASAIERFMVGQHP